MIEGIEMKEMPKKFRIGTIPHGVLACVSMTLAIFLSASSASALYTREGGLGVGARAMGMGGAFVSVADDVTASFWNPAGLVSLSRIEVGTMFGSLFNDKTRNAYLTAHYPTRDDIHLAVSVNQLFFAESGGAYEGDYSGSVAIPLTRDRALSAGLNVHYLRADLKVAGGTARGVGADLGFLFRKPLKGKHEFRAGLIVTDIATSVRFPGGVEQEVPRLVTPGLSFVFRHDTLFALDASLIDDPPLSSEESVRFRGGVEHWLFDRRLGFRSGYVGSTTLSGMFSFGTSYHARRWSLDYAFLGHPRELGNSHRVSATWKFGRLKDEDPFRPLMLRTLVSDGLIHLEWSMPEPAADAPAVEGFWVYLQADGQSEFQRIRTDLLAEKECVLRGAQNGKGHRLYVTAVVQGQEKAPSREILATPRAMTAEARHFYDMGLAQFEEGKISASLYAARKAEELDPNDWMVKELLRKLDTAMKKGLIEPESIP